jgi:hypothetical protein
MIWPQICMRCAIFTITYIQGAESGTGSGHPFQRGVGDIAAATQVQVPKSCISSLSTVM